MTTTLAPPPTTTPADVPALENPAHLMVLAAALAASEMPLSTLSLLPDHRAVDNATRRVRAQRHPWEIVATWRDGLPAQERRTRWSAAAATVTRCYDDLVRQFGELPDYDTADAGGLFLPPALRGTG